MERHDGEQRTVNRTPRHLDDPIKLGPFTIAQVLLGLAAVALLWPLATWATFLPLLVRVVIASALVGAVLNLGDTGGQGSIITGPKRGLHDVITPTDYLAIPPRRGALRLVLFDDEQVEEESPDA